MMVSKFGIPELPGGQKSQVLLLLVSGRVMFGLEIPPLSPPVGR